MYLVDTNIWIERLLDQEQSAEVGQLLSKIPGDQLLVSDFTLHSIGIILDRLKHRPVLVQFVDDVFLRGGATLVSVQPQAMHQVVATMDRFHLDFDDAYQYVAAEQFGAVIISFDGHFDHTDRGRQAPMDVLASVGRNAEV